MVHGFDEGPTYSVQRKRDNLLSKVGQLNYRFIACNHAEPNTVLLGRLQMEEFTQLVAERCLYVGIASPSKLLLGLEVRMLDEPDACQVALLGHKE